MHLKLCISCCCPLTGWLQKGSHGQSYIHLPTSDPTIHPNRVNNPWSFSMDCPISPPISLPTGYYSGPLAHTDAQWVPPWSSSSPCAPYRPFSPHCVSTMGPLQVSMISFRLLQVPLWAFVMQYDLLKLPTHTIALFEWSNLICMKSWLSSHYLLKKEFMLLRIYELTDS